MTEPSTRTTSADADTAMAAFLDRFWDPAKKYFYTYSDRQIHPEHAVGPEDGLYTDFWWEAQLWDVVMDAYERTRGSAYRKLIDDVYDGFAACYPTFLNDYNDDMGWWAQGSARAYELTGSQHYLDRARTVLDSVLAYCDDTYGGGIWWRRSVQDQKNVATNAPAAITATKVYVATGDVRYLDQAQALYSWVKTALQSAGPVYDRIESPSGTLVKTDYTYNPGNYLGAASALYKATGDSTYLSDAIGAADWAVANLAKGGTLPFEGTGDGGGFKPILVRHLDRLARDHGQVQYLGFLQHNAEQAWNHRRTSDDLIGPDWSVPAPAGPLQSLSAGAGASILQIAG